MVRAMVSAGGVICTTLYDFLVCFVAAVKGSFVSTR